jgi:DNA mismatch repair ATPase MutS
MSTPLMKQYSEVKAKYPGTILLFRMGDFFETFDEDAKVTSRVLGITLTRRGNGAAGETPLAGFPHHALDTYLPKLLKAGLRVAICEQLEDPKFAKGIVKRDVIEVVSPGVAFSDKVLDQKQNNYLAAIALPSAVATGDDIIGFSYVDISTGEFATAEIPFRALEQQINSITPSEIIVQKHPVTKRLWRRCDVGRHRGGGIRDALSQRNSEGKPRSYSKNRPLQYLRHYCSRSFNETESRNHLIVRRDIRRNSFLGA